ncbi:MAG TPA: Clp protease N-terminal domain-containing protein [Micromonosporaceae bacterium]|nr:Clp protease N-terminal domain-containing protein [Micromonosporaceae bacterium]
MDELPVRLDDLISYVRRQAPGGDALAHLTTAVLLAQQVDDLADHVVGHFVDEARRAGASWTQIGQSMGVTKQAAQKRFVPSGAELFDLLSDGVFDRFTDRAKRALLQARQHAREAGHDRIGSEHIVLGLLAEPAGLAARAIEASGVTLDAVREAVVAGFPPAAGPDRPPRPAHPPFTPGAKRVRDLTVREALRLGHNYLGTEHILLGLLSAEEEPGAQVLTGLGVSRDGVEQCVLAALDELRRRRRAG